jgi:hypothetical protein
MILVNGETGKVGYYGLFNLGEAGVGYYAFQIFVDANDIVSITIPAGTKFPTRAMTDLFTVNNNPVYIMYEVEKEITLYKIEKTTKLSFHTLKAIETGKYGYSLETLFVYLDAIGVDMDINFK